MVQGRLLPDGLSSLLLFVGKSIFKNGIPLGNDSLGHAVDGRVCADRDTAVFFLSTQSTDISFLVCCGDDICPLVKVFDHGPKVFDPVAGSDRLETGHPSLQ